MRLYASKISPIAADMVAQLIDSGSMESEPEKESEINLDIESVLKEYIRTERDITNKARELIADRGLEFRQLHKLRHKLAVERKFGIGHGAFDYLTQQIIGALFHSRYVAEIYVEDHVLRKTMSSILKQHLNVEEDLDKEVRNKIKNLQEGTGDWEVEYQKVMEDMKRIKGLED